MKKENMFEYKNGINVRYYKKTNKNMAVDGGFVLVDEKNNIEEIVVWNRSKNIKIVSSDTDVLSIDWNTITSNDLLFKLNMFLINKTNNKVFIKTTTKLVNNKISYIYKLNQIK